MVDSVLHTPVINIDDPQPLFLFGGDRQKPYVTLN